MKHSVVLFIMCEADMYKQAESENWQPSHSRQAQQSPSSLNEGVERIMNCLHADFMLSSIFGKENCKKTKALAEVPRRLFRAGPA